MDRDFSQIKVSESLIHLKENIKERWNLEDYDNPNLPAVFFGVYNANDLKIILDHNSYGIIIFGGNDLQKDKVLQIFNIKKDKFFTFGYAWLSSFFDKYQISYKEMILPIKDFNAFNLTPLGKNIYVYVGQPEKKRYDYFYFDEIIVPLIDNFGEKRVMWVKEDSAINIQKLIEDYYNKSFVFVKPNERGGSTTMWEMAHMGRKTIAQNQGGAPNVLEYSDLDHMIDLIYQESEKIGTIQEDIYNNIKNIFQESDEWLYLKFWL